MAHKIDTPTARAKLAPRRAPYWHKDAVNRFVGFRYMTEGSSGSWSAKIQEGRKERNESYGTLEEFPEDQRFKEAQSRARKWFASLEAEQGTSEIKVPAKLTLKEALEEYVLHVKERKDEGNATSQAGKADYIERRFNLLVNNYRMPGVAWKPGETWIDYPLSRLTHDHFAGWRRYMEAMPVQRGPKRGEPRTSTTVDRDLAAFMAALNHAADVHKLANHWKRALKKTNDNRKTARGDWVYQTLAQRGEFIAACAGSTDARARALAPFATMLCIMPVRPGGLAASRVKDYDTRRHMVFVHTDKANPGRWVPVPKGEAQALIKAAMKDKLPNAPLFTDAAGEAWDAQSWGDAVRALRATEGTSVDPAFTLYWLRHARITDLVESNMPLPKIAKLAGTSSAMIEKTYYHAQDAHEALEVPGYARAA